MSQDALIRVEGLRKSFGSLEVLKDINFEVNPGEVVTIIGASGSGKSTLLRCINLLETPDAGHVWYHGEDLTGPKTDVDTLRQSIGMVFRASISLPTRTCWITARSPRSRSRRWARPRPRRSPWSTSIPWAWPISPSRR